MFNLLIAGHADAWESGEFEFDTARFAIEYTAPEVSERYRDLNRKNIEELKSFPTLFAIEGDREESRVGFITSIHPTPDGIAIEFKFDPLIPALPAGSLKALREPFELGRFEITRTHWAIKDGQLFEILFDRGLIDQDEFGLVLQAQLEMDELPKEDLNGGAAPGASQIFIVHGQDEIAKRETSDYVHSIGLQPIILHLQASMGHTIIEKFEKHSSVGFGIVLYTPCDEGKRVGSLIGRYRARQNVVFEHGYLMAKLGRSRVCALLKGDVETPNDISGVVYIQMDNEGDWKFQLASELRAAGYKV